LLVISDEDQLLKGDLEDGKHREIVPDLDLAGLIHNHDVHRNQMREVTNFVIGQHAQSAEDYSTS